MNVKCSMFRLASILLALVLFAFSAAGQGAPLTRNPGEGLWRPGQIELPSQVSHTLLGVVRIHPRSLRFRLTLFETAEAAAEAQKDARTGAKEFAENGAVVWPFTLARPILENICSKPSAPLSPLVTELCQAFETANCTAYPCKITTGPMAASATGVAVARLPDGMDVILTAYHVARESIEKNLRTSGQHTLAPIPIDELMLEYSSDPIKESESYRTVPHVYLLANASEKEFLEGADWALLGVRSSEAPGLIAVPLATNRPKRADPLWILGFPFRTQRPTAPVLGYSQASGDLRVSYGLAVGTEDLGTNSPYILTNADIVSGDSGGPLINANGEVVGIVHNSLCKPDGALDLGTLKFCGVTLGTSIDTIDSKLLTAGAARISEKSRE